MDKLAWRYWLALECEQGDALFDAAGALLEHWRRFAKKRGVEPGSAAEFAAAMEGRGLTCDRLQGERKRIRWGVRLKQPADHPRGEG